MSRSRKIERYGARKDFSRNARARFLPMPRRDADALALQYRLALEAVRCQRAERRDAISMAHVVLFTLFLTEAGHGLLDIEYLRKVEGELAAVLKHGETTGEWGFPSSLLEPLIIVVNEHDRQLREVRLSEIAAATRRLDQRRAVAIRLADKERTATN